MHTERLAVALQLVVEYDLSGTPAAVCPAVYTHRLALKSSIQELRTKADLTVVNAANKLKTPGKNPATNNAMDSTPIVQSAGNQARELADSPPPTTSATKLKPRNLQLDLDSDMPEAIRYDNSTAIKVLQNLEVGTTTGQNRMTPSNESNQHQTENASEPLQASQFRNLCGNPTGLENRIAHLEHHAALMMAHNREEKERTGRADVAASNRELQLAAKAEELHTLVENHIADGVERVLRVEDKVDKHDTAIKVNMNNILAVNKDLHETKTRFELFVEKADKILESQRDTAQATNDQLALLQKHLNENNGHRNQPYLQSVVEGAQNTGPIKEAQSRPEEPNQKGVRNITPTQGAQKISTLKRRGDNGNQLIEFHLKGLTLLYFERELQGNIRETREKINEQLNIKHVVKSINFLGDQDNNLTEVCVPARYAKWFSNLINSYCGGDRVLGEQYEECNPILPKWDNIGLMPHDVQKQRLPQHVKHVMDQWFQCAKRSQSEAIREFYKRHLNEVAANRQLWCELVHEVKFDDTLIEFPKVTPKTDDPPPDPNRPNKRRATAKDGPSNRTPISVARKRKEPKQNEKDKGTDDAAMEDANNESTHTTLNNPLHQRQPQDAQNEIQEHDKERRQPQIKVHRDSQPADKAVPTTNTNRQRESSHIAAGDKENMEPC